jgi:hypothetical protein
MAPNSSPMAASSAPYSFATDQTPNRRMTMRAPSDYRSFSQRSCRICSGFMYFFPPTSRVT